jgi:hypothetical protein
LGALILSAPPPVSAIGYGHDPAMTRPLRTVLLAASAAAAVTSGHLLDALGLLPGVHESAAVRTVALAPAYTCLTVLGAAALAGGVAGLLRRERTGAAVGALVGGQTALLALPEVLGRVEEGDGEEWGGLALAVGVQLVLAVAAVAAARALADRVLVVLLHGEVRPRPLPPPAVPRRKAPSGRLVGGVRGRGPPVRAVP